MEDKYLGNYSVCDRLSELNLFPTLFTGIL